MNLKKLFLSTKIDENSKNTQNHKFLTKMIRILMKLVQNLSKFDQEFHETIQNPSKPQKHQNLMKIQIFINFLRNYFGKFFLSGVVARAGGAAITNLVSE